MEIVIEDCPKHGRVDHCVRFEPRSSRKRGDYLLKRVRCRECDSEYQRERAAKRKRYFVDLLGGQCIRCGYSHCLAALEFHHQDPKKKEFSFNRYRSVDLLKLQDEVEKCILLCANCHREMHYE